MLGKRYFSSEIWLERRISREGGLVCTAEYVRNRSARKLSEPARNLKSAWHSVTDPRGERKSVGDTGTRHSAPMLGRSWLLN